MLHAALDAGINFIDTAPVYGERRRRRDAARRHPRGRTATTSSSPPSAATTSTAERSTGTQRERPHDWRPASIRAQLEDSLRRLGTDYVDLYQLHNCRIEPVRDDALWETLDALVAEGKVRELGVALGPAIGWVEEGLESIRDRDICSLQTVFNVLEQEPGLTFAREPKVADGTRRASCRACPHASDTLSSKITPDTVFPPGDHRVAPQPREHARQLREGRDARRSSGRAPAARRGQAAIAGILANPAFATVLPTCVDVDEVREYAAASDLPAHRRRGRAPRRPLRAATSTTTTATRCR